MSSLIVLLNGHDVSSHIAVDSCDALFCKLIGTIEKADGLQDGDNMLAAYVASKDNLTARVQRASFIYRNDLTRIDERSSGSSSSTSRLEPAWKEVF